MKFSGNVDTKSRWFKFGCDLENNLDPEIFHRIFYHCTNISNVAGVGP